MSGILLVLCYFEIARLETWDPVLLGSPGCGAGMELFECPSAAVTEIAQRLAPEHEPPRPSAVAGSQSPAASGPRPRGEMAFC